jgi:hypothetical protein
LRSLSLIIAAHAAVAITSVTPVEAVTFPESPLAEPPATQSSRSIVGPGTVAGTVTVARVGTIKMRLDAEHGTARSATAVAAALATRRQRSPSRLYPDWFRIRCVLDLPTTHASFTFVAVLRSALIGAIEWSPTDSRGQT